MNDATGTESIFVVLKNSDSEVADHNLPAGFWSQSDDKLRSYIRKRWPQVDSAHNGCPGDRAITLWF